MAPPQISQDGELSFAVAADEYGTVHLQVRLSDNGGNDSQGFTGYAASNSVVKLFQINVYAPSESSRTVDYVVPSTVRIFEGSGRQLLVSFLQTWSSGVPNPQFEGVSLSVSAAEPVFFEELPSYSGFSMSNPAQDNLNVLSFEMAPYVFGDTIIYMQLTDHRLTPKNTTYEIIVRVLPINDRPSFEIVTEISVAEAGGLDAPTATITCSGGCSCPPSSPTTSGAGAIWGTKRSLLSDSRSSVNCKWLIASTRAISLSFTYYDSQSSFNYVSVNRCNSPSCGTVEELARMNGCNGFTAEHEADKLKCQRQWDTTYVSSTGFLEVVWTSEYFGGMTGFVALWSLAGGNYPVIVVPHVLKRVTTGI